MQLFILFVVVTACLSSSFCLCDNSPSSSSSSSLFELATHCLNNNRFNAQEEMMLSPVRLKLFETGMKIAISNYSQQFPQWFFFINSDLSIIKEENYYNENNNNNCLSILQQQRAKQMFLNNKNKKNKKNKKLLMEEEAEKYNNNHDYFLPSNAFAESLQFLLKWMPKHDEVLPIEFFLDTVSYSLKARALFSFAKEIDFYIFLNNVLPYAALSEPRDPWRPKFFDYFSKQKDLINNKTSKQLSVKDAAQWMNTKGAWYFPNSEGNASRIVFKAAPPNEINNYSPFQVLQKRFSSCTGLAVYLTMCVRAIGLPARATLVPGWNACHAAAGDKRNVTCKVCPFGANSDPCSDHTFSETMVDAESGWSFFDNDGERLLNTSWFFPSPIRDQVPVKNGFLNRSVLATSWANASFWKYQQHTDPLAVPVSHCLMVWDPKNDFVNAFDVTRRYLSMLL